MELQVIRYESGFPPELEEFEDRLHSMDYIYQARHLVLAGLKVDDIHESIRRAMKVCTLNNIDTADHFRAYYVYDEHSGSIYCDWRMTREGFTLVIMQSSHENETIAHWQWELASRVSLPG